jgi:hypothetical protein
VPETGPLRSTWRELETWPWLPDCGPSRKRWNHHRRLPVRAPVLDPTERRTEASAQARLLRPDSHEALVTSVERRGCLSSEKVIANRETGMSIYLPRRFVIARWQMNGWDEPCKSRGLRTVLWAAGGEIPPADPALSQSLRFC